MTTYPLGLPEELMEEVKRTAADTHLSMADAMLQAIKIGLPQVREGAVRESDLAEAAAETLESLPFIPNGFVSVEESGASGIHLFLVQKQVAIPAVGQPKAYR